VQQIFSLFSSLSPLLPPQARQRWRRKAAVLVEQGKKAGTGGGGKGKGETKEDDGLQPFPLLRGASRKPNLREGAYGSRAHHDHGMGMKIRVTF
jgi:hypothetical protein